MRQLFRHDDVIRWILCLLDESLLSISLHIHFYSSNGAFEKIDDIVAVDKFFFMVHSSLCPTTTHQEAVLGPPMLQLLGFFARVGFCFVQSASPLLALASRLSAVSCRDRPAEHFQSSTPGGAQTTTEYGIGGCSAWITATSQAASSLVQTLPR